jgi:hypothetical protein
MSQSKEELNDMEKAISCCGGVAIKTWIYDGIDRSAFKEYVDKLLTRTKMEELVEDLYKFDTKETCNRSETTSVENVNYIFDKWHAEIYELLYMEKICVRSKHYAVLFAMQLVAREILARGEESK